MPVKSSFAAAACGLAAAAIVAGSALAGEIRGPGSPTGVPDDEGVATAAPAHTNSLCAFSGLNHIHPGAPGELPIRTQSYGQLVAAGLKDAPFAPSPGVACNGHLSGLHG